MENAGLSINAAANALTGGKLLFYPTETFYALGCDALNPEAVRKVYAAKRRRADSPLPVIIGDPAQLELLTTEVGALAEELMRLFWPGPLSILFRRAAAAPELLSAGTGKVAVRLSSHPAARKLCVLSSRPLVSSSANTSGHKPAAVADALEKSLLERVRELNQGELCLCVADGDTPPQGKLPSTVVEVLEERGKAVLRVLRKGAVSLEDLRAGIPPETDIVTVENMR
jgi:L-threonylcarbamoyladenylate synthase